MSPAVPTEGSLVGPLGRRRATGRDARFHAHELKGRAVSGSVGTPGLLGVQERRQPCTLPFESVGSSGRPGAHGLAPVPLPERSAQDSNERQFGSTRVCAPERCEDVSISVCQPLSASVMRCGPCPPNASDAANAPQTSHIRGPGTARATPPIVRQRQRSADSNNVPRHERVCQPNENAQLQVVDLPSVSGSLAIASHSAEWHACAMRAQCLRRSLYLAVAATREVLRRLELDARYGHGLETVSHCAPWLPIL